ncbi:MAG: cysteine desulfurase NifS [Methylococcales bacterium]|nr:cysteine desulfurase NifS [Methylococcales bacterium]
MTDIYLDNNATTKVDHAVVDAMIPYFLEQYGNPSSIHKFADGVARGIKQARGQVQALIGCEHDSEIIFTSCGTESNTTAILSAIKCQPNRKEIITTTVEHPAILGVCVQLEKEGYTIHRLPVDKCGRLNLDSYQKMLSENVALVTVMWANNETGTIFPVVEMADMANAAGVMFHTDAVQAVGKIPMMLADTKIDMLSISGHKLHAPKGIGVLYLRRGVRYRPLLRGGHQERGRRAGTENTASIVGLGKACELALQHIEYENTQVKALRDKLERGIIEAVPHSFVTGDLNNRLPNTTDIAFEYIEGESILMLLNKAGIAASSGSACTSGSLEPSHVMQAMDIPYTAAHGTIRFSFSRYNSMADVDEVLKVMPGIAATLRKLSPYWSGDAPVANPEQAFSPTYS